MGILHTLPFPSDIVYYGVMDLGLPVRKLKTLNWLRIAAYAVIVVTIALVTMWALGVFSDKGNVHPAHQPAKPDNPLYVKGSVATLPLISRDELFAPAVLPWSPPNISRTPTVEVLSVRVITVNNNAEPVEAIPEKQVNVEEGNTGLPEETGDRSGGPSGEIAPPIDYTTLMKEAVAFRVPTLFRPYTLNSSPPYLLSPVVVDFDFYLGPDATVTKCSVRSDDISPEMQNQIMERSYGIRFPVALALVDFTCRVRITPYTYSRLIVTRGGNKVNAELYRKAFRVLQYSSGYLTVALQSGEGDLLDASAERDIFMVIDGEGVPSHIDISPPVIDPEASKLLPAAISYIRFPPELNGCNITIKLGAS